MKPIFEKSDFPFYFYLAIDYIQLKQKDFSYFLYTLLLLLTLSYELILWVIWYPQSPECKYFI